MSDLEKQNLVNQSSEQYGAVDAKKGSIAFRPEGSIASAEKLPLLLGRWAVSPDQLCRVGFAAYVTWFVIHRMADLAYVVSIDGRFPEGLSHLYPSDAQRYETISYTRQVLLLGLAHRCLVFAAVVAMCYFRLFAKIDAALRSCFTSIGNWWATSGLRAFFVRSSVVPLHLLSTIWFCLTWLLAPIGRCLWPVCGRPCTWLANLKDRTLNGRLTSETWKIFCFPLSIGELALGGVYLTLISCFFFALSTPFMYYQQVIDLKFGFANSLSVSVANFKGNVVAMIISMLIMGPPKKFMFLAILQYRIGWVLMWAVPMMAAIYGQYNITAGMMGMKMVFPTGNFAVGRGFPMVETAVQGTPWMSLNRLYFPDPFTQSLAPDAEISDFYTQDKSKGALQLAKHNGKWTISGTGWFDPSTKVYAETKGPAQNMEGLKDQSWSVGGESTRMGVRSGKALRSKLFGFAAERHIGIGDIYMVDGSHRDARANAFVTGAGNHSIIGLYDTLFLGNRGSDQAEEVDDDADSPSMIQDMSEAIQGVDVEREGQDRRAPRSSATSAAMNDDEIVAILAHELAHSAMKHMEMGMTTQVFTSFLTFATLGWMASSPLAASALSLSMPILHVGACAYDHVVGPPVTGVMKLFTDGLTRHNEYEADAYAAKISEKYGTGMQTALAKLTVNSNQDPDPPFFFEALHSDHPPFARRWAHIDETMKATYGKDYKSLVDASEKP
jgi:Zn-dependent protease with chaperone function